MEQWLILKLSDLRYSRLQVFVSGQSNVSYRQKNQVLGADFSEGRNHFETFQGGLIMKLRDFRCFRLRVFIFGQSNILYMPKNQLLGADFSKEELFWNGSDVVKMYKLFVCMWTLG